MGMHLARTVAVLAFVAGSGLALPSPEASADVEIDIDVFHDRLAPHGRWFWHPRYRQVWAPRGVPVGWRPYTRGRWAYTDDGWFWDSDYPWGWATFHYGRWLFDDDLGWVWVPGTRWAPAWVTWRYGPGYIGWAPLPPWADLDRWDDDFDLAPPHWIFVEERYFLTPRLHPVIVLPARNVTIFDRCRHRARPRFVRQRWVNPGVDVHLVEQATRSRVARAKVREVGVASAAGFGDDDEVRVFRPAVRPSSKEAVKALEHAESGEKKREQVKPEEEKARIVDGAERVRAVRRSEIQEYYDAQAEALRKQQATESARRRQKEDAQARESLRRRHEAEQRALEQGRQREKHAFEQRSKIERGPAKALERRPQIERGPAKALEHGVRAPEASKTSTRGVRSPGARSGSSRSGSQKGERATSAGEPSAKIQSPGR